MEVQKFRRGQIWWMRDDNYDFIDSTQKGTRPVIIVSNDNANKYSTNVTIIPCTTAEKKELPTHLSLHIIQESTLLGECITTIPVSRLTNYIGTCDKELLTEIDKVIKIALGIKDYNLQYRYNNQSNIQQDKKDKKVVNNITENIKNNKRTRYTKEYKIQFINDCKNYNKQYILDKYKLNSIKTISSRLYLWTKELQGNEESK